MNEMLLAQPPSRDLLTLAAEAIFWVCVALVVYTYIGYALLLRILPDRPTLEPQQSPHHTVSILMAAHNEELSLQAKLDNLAQLDYPQSLIQTIVVSDGSSDRTAAILGRSPNVSAIILPQPLGKAAALNHAAEAATGSILVFFDIRQTIDLDAVRHLLAPFTDPLVGAVSGELVLETVDGAQSAGALGIYWRIEKFVRKLESRTGSVVGVTGAIYAMRRSLYQPMPAGTLLDDVFLPMYVVRAGSRVLFQPNAIARDRVFTQKGKEFGRKVRTLTGNYQLLQLAPWLLTPANPLLFRFISHKLMRLVVPLLLIVLLVASSSIPNAFYRTITILQLVFYGLAACGTVLPQTRQVKPIAIANTFVMLNLAAAKALINFLTGRNAWV